ncbi:MAG: ABC transporter ATP-binding protein, partial [Thermoguttaceae bacterium]|nr:ABC transporter ATP-binding protein [Thermoguttaceae bacterium]
MQTDFIAEEWKVVRKEKIVEFLSRVITLLGYGGVLWLLIDALVAGEIGVGAFAAVFNALRNFFEDMDKLVWDLTRGLSQSAGKASNTLRFLDYEEEYGEPLEPKNGEICLQNVSFAYPDREENAVDGVSLTIREGETVAIVGENGAGKSTLVRLLTGLYPPSEGKVTVGGVDTAVADPGGIRKHFSAVFQQYGKYK